MPADQTENIAAAITEISERMSILIREEVELAKVEMTRKATSIARGAAAIAAGAVFGVFAIIYLLSTIAWGINAITSTLWIGFLVVLILLVIAAVAAFLFARKKLNVGTPAPTMAIDEAKRIRDTVTASTEGRD